MTRLFIRVFVRNDDATSRSEAAATILAIGVLFVLSGFCPADVGTPLKCPEDFEPLVIDKPITEYAFKLEPLKGCSAGYRAWFHGEMKKALTAGDLTGLRNALQKRLRLPANAGADQLRKQVGDSDATMALAQYALIRDLGGPLPYYTLHRDRAQQFYMELLTDRDLLETILISGLARWMLPEAESNICFIVIMRLQGIWERDPLFARHRTTRNLAVGLSVACTNRQQLRMIGERDIRDLYAFYRSSWLRGRLDRSFGDTEAWAMRYFASTPGIPASYLYAQKHIRTPMAFFSKTHYRIPRRSVSMYGAPMGFTMAIPWIPYVGNSFLRKSLITGGVCGAQSSSSTIVIGSRGVPSFVIGCNGHCAYAWRHPEGRIVGAYGGPDSNGHYGLYGFSPAFLYVAEDAHRDVKAVLQARRHAWQAQLADDLNMDSVAGGAWQLATDGNPGGYVTWHERLSWLSRHADHFERSSVETELMTGMKRHPYPMLTLLGLIEKQAHPDLKNRGAMWERFYATTARNWKVNRYLEHTLRDHLLRLENANEKMVLAGAVLKALFSSKVGGYVMQWAEKQYPDTPEGRKRQALALKEVLANAKTTDASGARAIGKLYGSLIANAAEVGDENTFNSMAARARKVVGVRPGKLPGFERFPGVNLGRGGILLLRSRNADRDRPELHPWVLDDEKGGEFCAAGKQPSATVRLPRVGKISGIVLIGHTKGWVQDRLVPSVVEVSEYGKKWRQVARLTKKQRVYRVPVKDIADYIRFVRVRHEGSQERYAFYGFFVYGKPKQ